jgi:hypothetical protein
MFIPMTPTAGGPRGYLVIVALNDVNTDKPNWDTLKAFVASVTQAFNYNAGTWHHPMIALEAVTDFGIKLSFYIVIITTILLVCVVHERNESQIEAGEDCEEVHLAPSVIYVKVEGFKGAKN